MAKLIVSPFAREDISSTLVWSELTFGVAASARYEALLLQAMRDVAEDPERVGVSQVGARADLKTYRLFFSRDRIPAYVGRVKSPRHLILFRPRSDAVEILRILHEAMDVDRHLPADDD